MGRVLPGAEAPGLPVPDPQRLRKSSREFGAELAEWYRSRLNILKRPPLKRLRDDIRAKVAYPKCQRYLLFSEVLTEGL